MAGGNRGQHIDGRFELLEPLGSGGMGTVWRALDLVLQREVALKEVRPPDAVMAPEDSPASRKLRERVVREARALARINHPAVVTIYHIIDEPPHPWLVMELVPGTNVEDRLSEGPLDPQEAASIGRQVLGGLRAAHAVGIHHRDVKPANVLLRKDGSAVLTDFGIAALQGSTSLTATGELIGSPEYIAPERIRGTTEDPAADLWSLGMMLYIAVEGVSPLRRQTALATLAAVLDEPVPPPVRSGALGPVLSALLVRDPAARPDSAQLDAMLARVASGAAAAPPPPTPTYVPTQLASPAPELAQPSAPLPPKPDAVPEQDGRRRGSRMAVLGVIAGALALLGGLVGGTVLITRDDDREDAKGGLDTESPLASDSPTEVADPTPSSPLADQPSLEQTTPVAPESPRTPPASSAPSDTTARGWVAQLFSEPTTSGTGVRDKQLAAVRKSVPQAQVLRSDDYASLRPGYWVIYAPGPFTDGRSAVNFCAQHGRLNSNNCVGRYLSGNTADRAYVCHPQNGGSGRCSRS